MHRLRIDSRLYYIKYPELFFSPILKDRSTETKEEKAERAVKKLVKLVLARIENLVFRFSVTYFRRVRYHHDESSRNEPRNFT